MKSRFVILEHRTGRLREVHWDLMLERDEGLWTWQVEAAPMTWGEGKVCCQRLADHRKAYLDYEGSISGHRGTVRRVEAGWYCWDERWGEPYRFYVEGDHLRGVVILTELESSWQLEYRAGVPG